MHSLEVIVAKNLYAAGREAGHADNDWNDREASAIQADVYNDPTLSDAELKTFNTGYLAGKREG